MTRAAIGATWSCTIEKLGGSYQSRRFGREAIKEANHVEDPP
jgi:hypothetical protein